MDKKIKEAEENESDIEMRDALLNKALYQLNEMKDLTSARLTLKQALAKTASK